MAFTTCSVCGAPEIDQCEHLCPEIDSEDLVASWRAPASGDNKLKVELPPYELPPYDKGVYIPPGTLIQEVNHGELAGLGEDDHVGYPMPSVAEIAASEPQMSGPSHGLLFNGISHPGVPVDIQASGMLATPVDEHGTPGLPVSGVIPTGLGPIPVAGVEQTAQYELQELSLDLDPTNPNAINGMINSITDPGHSDLFFWRDGKEIFRIEGETGRVVVGESSSVDEATTFFWEQIQLKNPIASLNKIKERIKELEIKLGYRKSDKEEEPIDRFSNLDVD